MSDKSTFHLPKKRGRKSIADGAESHARKQRKIYLSEEEWMTITRKSTELDRRCADYIRDVALGYKPLPPDPEFRKELMRVRMDLKNLFAFVNSRNWSDEEREKRLAETDIFIPCTKAIFEKEIKFLEKWIKRL